MSSADLESVEQAKLLFASLSPKFLIERALKQGNLSFFTGLILYFIYEEVWFLSLKFSSYFGRKGIATFELYNCAVCVFLLSHPFITLISAGTTYDGKR